MHIRQHARLVKALLRAFHELPLPFTIVESGNFCGAVTLTIALAKAAFCPDCPFITIDPTLQAHQTGSRDGKTRGAYYRATNACSAKKTIEHFGLSSMVDAREQFGADLSLPSPVGFAYYDDGKIREAMAPQLALIEPYLMEGAYLAFDDYAQKHTMKGSEDRTVYDHKELMEELASTGDYTVVAANELKDNFGCLRRTTKAAQDEWARLEIELVERRTHVTHARRRTRWSLPTRIS